MLNVSDSLGLRVKGWPIGTSVPVEARVEGNGGEPFERRLGVGEQGVPHLDGERKLSLSLTPEHVAEASHEARPREG